MGYGGALIWTGLARNLKIHYPEKKIIFLYKKPIRNLLFYKPHSDHIIYKNNSDISLIIDKVSWLFIKHKFNKNEIILVDMDKPSYLYWEKDTKEKIYYKTGAHAIQIACNVHGITNAILQPKIVLTSEEENKVNKLLKTYGLEENKYICIEPHAKISFSPNKAWFWDHWEALVCRINKLIFDRSLDFKIVQIGLKTDKILKGVIDLTGSTSFRETSRIISYSRTFIGCEGGLVHLSQAVCKNSIVLISAMMPKELVAYPKNINFYTDIECKHCGLKIPCPINRKCMQGISVESVFESFKKLLLSEL